jgi:hypothetical protein
MLHRWDSENFLAYGVPLGEARSGILGLAFSLHLISMADLSVGIAFCSLWSILTSVQMPKPRYWLSQKRVWEDAKQNSPSHGRKRK